MPNESSGKDLQITCWSLLRQISPSWRNLRHKMSTSVKLFLFIKRFRFYRNLLLFFEFRYYPYYYYYSFFSGHAIIIPNLQNRITFSHQTPLIHGPLSTHCSARFGVDPDYRSGSRARSVFSDFPQYLRN